MNFLQNVELWVDTEDNPNILKYSIPYFHIFAGSSVNEGIEEIFTTVPERHQFIFPNQSWERVAKEYWGKKLHSYTRHKFNPKNIDLESIQTLAKKKLQNNFKISEIDIETVCYIDKKISNYFSLYYDGPKVFMAKGVGYCIKDGNELASFATTFLPFRKNLEIQVITLEKYRRKGLALIACAKLIEYCLVNSITPCWDAANENSAKLALKLGYTDPISYQCYYWKKD